MKLNRIFNADVVIVYNILVKELFIASSPLEENDVAYNPQPS